jgi:hypothetical protein
MQIFCPYANPIKIARCLDNKRLNKQILECIQILSANTGIDVGWKIPKYVYNHPNTLLWKNGSRYLIKYCHILIFEFTKRRYKIHKCLDIIYKFIQLTVHLDYSRFDNLKHLTPDFCKKHQQLLLEKDYEYYSKYF